MDKIIKKVAETPAVVLDKTIQVSEKITKDAITETITITETIRLDQPIRKARDFWRMLGPGLTTGAADDDPSGIATYSQTGAQYGFQLLWLSALTFPLMSVIQEMCARIGLVTGRGLAANIRSHYPRWVLYTCTILLFGANTLNIGANLGAMAKAVQLLNPHFGFGILVVFFALLSLMLQIFLTYEKYARFLKYLALILLSYVVTAFLIKGIDWQQILRATVIPSMDFTRDQILLVCAILGTTISPYLFFWQTSQEVEGQILEGKTTVALRQAETTDEEIKNMRLDVWSGMFLSNAVMFFIILTCAATLNAAGLTTIETAADAAAALRPLGGESAYLLFALGIIGTGLLAIPVLAGSASYALSESLGWRHGLYRKLKEAYAFYGVIILSVLVGLAINFTGLDTIKALIYTAVVNGLIAPVILALIVGLSSNRKIMGNRANGPVAKILGWAITVIMVVAGVAAIVSMFI